MIEQLKTPITLFGVVGEGYQQGRTIDFPTANLDVRDQLAKLSTQPKPGVYFVTCDCANQAAFTDHPTFGLAYLGPRYVFGETKQVFEVYLYDFDQEIYGETLTVTLHAFLRPPQKAPSLKALKTQLEHDKQTGRDLIESGKYGYHFTT